MTRLNQKYGPGCFEFRGRRSVREIHETCDTAKISNYNVYNLSINYFRKINEFYQTESSHLISKICFCKSTIEFVYCNSLFEICNISRLSKLIFSAGLYFSKFSIPLFLNI